MVYLMIMASDYIYIFCIPGSGSSETCHQSSRSVPAEAAMQYQRGRRPSAAVFPRTSAHIPPPQTTSISNNNTSNTVSVRTLCRIAPSARSVGRINRPWSAVMDVPEDWAPLPARQRSGHVSCRASFPGPTCNNNNNNLGVQAGTADHGQWSDYMSFVDERFQYDMCALPSYATSQNHSRSHSPFYALHWSPRATSSPVRQSRPGSLCDARAKDCWRRVFNRERCVRCCLTVTTFRWLLLFFASIGAGCILSGVVLGVLCVSLGTSFLVLSVLFLGMHYALL